MAAAAVLGCLTLLQPGCYCELPGSCALLTALGLADPMLVLLLQDGWSTPGQACRHRGLPLSKAAGWSLLGACRLACSTAAGSGSAYTRASSSLQAVSFKMTLS